jgi:hypothetical protein
MSIDRHGWSDTVGKRSLSLDERRGIRDRLHQFRLRHYRTRQAMNRDAGVPHNTAAGWFDKNPRTPDTVSLVRIAERKNLNLNWLLLGEGPELRGVDGPSEVWPHLRRTLVAELVSHGASAQDAEALIPGEEMLFHFLMDQLLTGWVKWKGKPLPPRRAGIGRAIDRLLGGLNDPPLRSRSTRRLL